MNECTYNTVLGIKKEKFGTVPTSVAPQIRRILMFLGLPDPNPDP
jgi:hypothetical protein